MTPDERLTTGTTLVFGFLSTLLVISLARGVYLQCNRWVEPLCPASANWIVFWAKNLWRKAKNLASAEKT